MIANLTLVEIVGLVVSAVALIAVVIADRAGRRRRLRYQDLYDNNWRTLQSALDTLEQLLTGEHGLDETHWEEAIHESLNDAKLAVSVLKPKNGMVRKRHRSKTRATKSSAEKQADTE